MGSMGWAQCYWCPWWSYNPYIPGGVGGPLCDWCLQWFADGGGPYEPTAVQRAAGALQRLLPLPKVAVDNIAEFLEDIFAP